MPSLKLSNPSHRSVKNTSLHERAAKLQARIPAPKPPAAAIDNRTADDAELLSIGRLFEEAKAREDAACEACNAAARQNETKDAPPELEAAADDAGDIAAALAHRLAEIPAHTADGLRLKIRALAHYNPSFFRLKLPDSPDPDQVLARSLLLDARTEAPAPQPAEALVADILTHWPIWAAEQRDYDTPDAEKVEERRLALIDAADALPARRSASSPW